MKYPKIPAALITLCLFISGALQTAPLHAQEAAPKKFTLASPAFTDNGTLPSAYTCDGQRISPPLAWANAPSGTKFFAVTMHHIPRDGNRHVYLLLYNIPAKVNSLPENTREIGSFGVNTVNGQPEYTPPCSKGPGPKLYVLTIYALSASVDFPPGSAVTMDMLLDAIRDKTLDTAVLQVTYSRPGMAEPPPPRPPQ